MSMKFVLASHNPGKLAEMQSILSGYGVEVVSPAEVGVSLEVEETGVKPRGCLPSRTTPASAWTP